MTPQSASERRREAGKKYLGDQYCECGCIEYPHNEWLDAFVAGAEHEARESEAMRAARELAELAENEINFCEPCIGNAPDYVNDKGECMIYPHTRLKAALEAFRLADKGNGT